ncbi:hypothetical protein M422DRAFT_45669 [Sphaerobolus stellatus SS14]|nr:hypothetical protein M422DRAFT_45669 [Sphaerobolus stellatus SS14]
MCPTTPTCDIPEKTRLEQPKGQTLVKDRLKLPYDIDDWQTYAVHSVWSGYDSIVCAGTGYGKSVVFEGLAAVELNKIVFVISPLKALERDQLKQAKEKGLKAVFINKDNSSCRPIWDKVAHFPGAFRATAAVLLTICSSKG